MAWERYLDYLNAIALSGHRGGSHMETYINATGIGLSLPAVMALSDYDDIYECPMPPIFESVVGGWRVTSQMKTHIVTKMFPSNLIDFQPKGRLFPTLEIMAATIIMCHNEMKKKYLMTNPIVFKVHELFWMDTNLNTEQLRHLSIQIRDGFLNNNNTTKVVKKQVILWMP